jgi:hypothetical protein
LKWLPIHAKRGLREGGNAVNKLPIIIPAIMVPIMLFALQQMQVPDAVVGLTVGVLLGLSLLGFIRQRRCAAAD